MTSCVFLTAEQPISLVDWEAFCERRRIEHSPYTGGGNVYYQGGLRGVEIVFGKGVRQQGRQPGYFMPPPSASEITVSSFQGSNLREIATLARSIKRRFRCRCIGASEEVPIPAGWAREFEHEDEE